MTADADIPPGWDQLASPHGTAEADEEPPAPAPGRPGRALLLAATWTDLVIVLLISAAALGAARVGGYRTGLAALPWAAALALAWWLAAAAVLVLVRRGLPGMLAVGLAFGAPVTAGRRPLLLLTAAIQMGLLGIPAVLGPRHWPAAVAAGTPVRIEDTARAGIT